MLLLARDLEHIYQVFLRLLLFATPIFYTRAFLGGAALSHWLVLLNPFAQLIELSRSILIDGALPSAPQIASPLLLNGGAIWLMLRIFRRLEPRMAEYV